MKMHLAKIVMIGGTILATASTGFADDEAEKLVEEALPQMYHTCNSLVELADGDEALVLDVLGKIAAVSIYMREIDIDSLSLSEEQKGEVEGHFFQAISDGCAEDSNALLAGIVDDAVKAALGL